MRREEMFLHLGMVAGALTEEEAVQAIASSMLDGGLNPRYIKYIRDKLNVALALAGEDDAKQT
jgi:hypothetical protein